MADLVIGGQTIEAIVMPNGEELALGGGEPTLQSKTLNVSAAGTTTVTPDSGYDGLDEVEVNVPSAVPYIGDVVAYYTLSGQRKWRHRFVVAVETDEGDVAGWLRDGYAESREVNYNAVPTGTSVTPTESAQAIGGANYMMEAAVTVAAIPSTYVGSGITRRSSSDLTASGATVSVPAGYYQSAASKAVASGTEGTPTASKGSVSNHAVTVTPSVTNSAGYIAGGTKTGTGVQVTAAELVSGSETKTQNGTYDVTNLAEIIVNVSGGGGGPVAIATASKTLTQAASSIQFTDLAGEPTSFAVVSASDLSTGAAPYKSNVVVFDGTNTLGQYITNTSNAQMTYNASAFSYSYSNGTLTITGTSSNFQANEYKLVYSYGGSAADVGTAQVQVGSGATSITFPNIPENPSYWACIFTSDIGTSSGYTRALAVVNDGSSTYGMELGSAAQATANWSATYSNGSLTISSGSTTQGGYFHQPGYYRLVYVTGATVEITTEPLTVTQNGTYTAPTGKAYTPVTVNVSGGGGSTNVATTTWTNSSTSTVSHEFTGLLGTPKAAFLRCTSQLTRSSSNTYYYIADIVWDGTDTRGNYHLRSSGAYTDVPSTGTAKYNVTVGTNSITFSSTASSRSSAPGSFYNGTYELTYIY